jgi:hypothetical protein
MKAVDVLQGPGKISICFFLAGRKNGDKKQGNNCTDKK